VAIKQTPPSPPTMPQSGPFHDGRKIQTDALPKNALIISALKQSPCGLHPGSEDTELGVLMELEVSHGETEVYTGIQA
jgi:hypothetical protein